MSPRAWPSLGCPGAVVVLTFFPSLGLAAEPRTPGAAPGRPFQARLWRLQRRLCAVRCAEGHGSAGHLTDISRVPTMFQAQDTNTDTISAFAELPVK